MDFNFYIKNKIACERSRESEEWRITIKIVIFSKNIGDLSDKDIDMQLDTNLFV